MRKAYLPLTLFIVFLLSWYEPVLSKQRVAAADASPSTRLVYQAKELLSNLKSTRYRHRSQVDEATGLYVFDCSALICYLLGRAAPQSLGSVPIDPGHRHARAKNFYYTFADAPVAMAGNGWQRIVRLMDAKPGDLIAWRKDPLSKKGNTGHIVMVMEKPVQEKDGAIHIQILDASKSGHAQDTRKKGASGVGYGSMWFRVDEAGAPIAYHWSNPKRKPSVCPIAIGRPMKVVTSPN